MFKCNLIRYKSENNSSEDENNRAFISILTKNHSKSNIQDSSIINQGNTLSYDQLHQQMVRGLVGAYDSKRKNLEIN